jgi:outer membrane biosynthesis protein TonB
MVSGDPAKAPAKWLRLTGSLVAIVFASCATVPEQPASAPSDQPPAEAVAETPPPKTTSSPQPTPAPPRPQTTPRQAPARPPTPPPVRATPTPTPKPTATPQRSQTDLVALRLAQSFRVLRSGRSTIIVRPKSPPGEAATSPSLFEKAIILGKIRGVLNTSIPNTPDATANYHQGAATIDFPPAISPGAASTAVERTLAIDGVNEVTATFQPAR